MAIDTNVQTFTDAEMLAMARKAIVMVTLGQSYSANGRTYTIADLDKLKDLVTWLEARINEEAGDGGSVMAVWS